MKSPTLIVARKYTSTGLAEATTGLPVHLYQSLAQLAANAERYGLRSRGLAKVNVTDGNGNSVRLSLQGHRGVYGLSVSQPNGIINKVSIRLETGSSPPKLLVSTNRTDSTTWRGLFGLILKEEGLLKK